MKLLVLAVDSVSATCHALLIGISDYNRRGETLLACMSDAIRIVEKVRVPRFDFEKRSALCVKANDVSSLQMVQNCFSRQWQEGLIGALAIFDPGLFAYPANPFIGAGG